MKQTSCPPTAIASGAAVQDGDAIVMQTSADHARELLTALTPSSTVSTGHASQIVNRYWYGDLFERLAPHMQTIFPPSIDRHIGRGRTAPENGNCGSLKRRSIRHVLFKTEARGGLRRGTEQHRPPRCRPTIYSRRCRRWRFATNWSTIGGVYD